MGRNLTKKAGKYKIILCLAAASCIPVYFAEAKSVPKLNKKSVSIKVGQSVKIKVIHVSKKSKIKWSVKNKKIATVKKGKISGKKSGTTKVFAVVGKKKLVCKVKVTSAGKKKGTPAPAATNPAKPMPQNTVLPSGIATAVPTASSAPTVTESPVPVVTESPDPLATDPPGSDAYEKAMVSGLEEDYYKYFDRNYRSYIKIQEGVSAGKMQTVNYESSVVGAEREVYVYTPAGYQQDVEYPVVYMLHGIGCDGSQWVGMSIARALDNMIAHGEIKPVVAVFPSIVPKDGLNPNTFSQENIQAFADFVDEFTQDLEPFIFDHYSVSRERKDTGVCGLSMGGMEALELGFTLQNRFNYIGSFSAAPSLDTSLLRYADENVVPECVLLCSGTKDTTIGDNPLNYHNELTRNGVKHIWYLHPKGTHSTPVWMNGVINFMIRSYGQD